MKRMIIALALPLFLCGCSETNSEIQTISEETVEASVQASTEEFEFLATMEDIPDEQELYPADPLDTLNITPSDYFTPGIWTSENSDDTGNFYIFDEDGIHGKMIPMADADGIDFAYSISGSNMTMYVGEELTPYSAELERTSEDHVIIHMTFLGTQDELTYLSAVPESGFTFYPAARLAQMAEKYYFNKTGITLAGSEYSIAENDMVVIDLWVLDENGWRSDVESYTVSMFTAVGWSSITFDEIDLSVIATTETTEETLPEDDIPDIIEDFSST